MFLWIIYGLVLGVLVLVGGSGIHAYRTMLVNSRGDRVLASKPAKEIMKEFRALPKDNRPYDERTLESALAAIDLKIGRDNATEHFMHRGYESRWFDWDQCNCYTRRHIHCVGNDYTQIHNAIKDIAKAVEDRDYQMQMAGIAHQLDRVSEITEALRQEANIVKQVTKELI